jgi:predicted nucleotidyltransferase
MIALQELVAADKIADFCNRWQITELALFGSILRDDFGRDSDVDVLVTFAESAHWSLLDHEKMRRELEALFSRDVDLITRSALENSANWLRRKAILDSAQVVYQPVPHDP